MSVHESPQSPDTLPENLELDEEDSLSFCFAPAHQGPQSLHRWLLQGWKETGFAISKVCNKGRVKPNGSRQQPADCTAMCRMEEERRRLLLSIQINMISLHLQVSSSPIHSFIILWAKWRKKTVFIYKSNVW